MRPIDADSLGLTDMEIIMCNGDYKEALKMLIDKIEHAQTIEPRKGKWKEDKDYPNLAYLCSECEYFTTMRTNFCPGCGADMRDKI